MDTPTPSSEQRELSLIGKVEMRIALADSDSKLEGQLKTYLAPLLLKLASEHPSVKKKVVSLCQHINTRVQPRSIQLPVKALVEQFKAQDSGLVRHFDLLYIQQGATRLRDNEKAELLPVVINGISQSGSHGGQFFYLFLRLLDSFPLPLRGSKEDAELRTRFSISSEDSEFLAQCMSRFILFTPQRSSSPTCPGLASEEYAFFTLDGKQGIWDSATGGLNLLRTKTLAAKFLASGFFSEKERFIPALFASADPASPISDVGDDILKRALPATDLEDDVLIKQLWDLFLGTSGAPPVRNTLKLKILGLLSKSIKSTLFATNIIRLVEEGVSPPQDGEDTVMSNGPFQNVSLGREGVKLRAAIFTYVNFVARQGEKQTLRAIASQVVSRLREFVEDQGWPKPGSNEDLISRGYAYEVIGLLTKAGPRMLLVEEDRTTMDLLQWLFDSLAKDTSGNAVTVSIEESLSTVLAGAALLSFSLPEQEVLETLLVQQIKCSANVEADRIRSTRYVAVRFANRCLPYSSVKARWIDVLAMGATSDRQEVREEGERGLSPHWFRMLNGSNIEKDTLSIPSFENVVKEFFVHQTFITTVDPVTLVRRSQELYATSFPHMTAFALRVLIQQALQDAGSTVNGDSEWERRVDALLESDVATRESLKKYMRSITARSPMLLDILMCALFECLSSKTNSLTDHLIEILALSPDPLLQNHLFRIESLLPTLKVNDHRKRIRAAHAFGILASQPGADAAVDTDSIFEQLLDITRSWNTAVGSATSAVHGAVAALGYYFSRRTCRTGRAPEQKVFRSFLESLFDIFQGSRDLLVQEASHIAMGQMSMYGCLSTEIIDTYIGVQKVTDKLYEHAKGANETAILCLGQLSMILPETDEQLKYIEEKLHELHEIRQVEAHFSVGEALSYVAVGWRSEALATGCDVEAADQTRLGQRRSETLPQLVDRILNDCRNTKPALKKAAVMWLLCLVQFCGNELQGKLSQCQSAFRRCLSDRDELVQESASRGLGLVYEKGDRNLKDDLVRELVSSFSSDKQQLSGNISQETQLFEPGALPTGDGSVSTYKDIMSLAAEVGDSSLVYRFMSMASSNAIWSSRAAFGRFGLSKVLSDSSVDGYLANNPKLYPKLFRYRFDPNGGVQRSMNDIWNALVTDSSATIDKHFDAIMEDLLTNVLGREWRVRQACCAAIADLVQGRPLEKYEQYLERIWTQCFKVLDDIKESVRAAAASLARTLTGVLTRTLEADHSSTKNASTMLKHVIPFILSPSGMESSAKDVQMFSVATILAIITKANGGTIRAFIPELVERLLGLLGSLEHEAVNYVHLNAAKYNLTEQKIDEMRLSSVRGSPLMEAIERCVDLLDDETMIKLWPRMETAMRSAVSLPSKVGASRVLVSLSTRRMAVFKPYADDALRLIERLVIDRNDTVASSYAVAAGYVTRNASEKQIVKLIAFAKELYFHSEGDREGVVPKKSITSGEIVHALAKHASEKFNAVSTLVLPFVFVAMHDSNQDVKERFQETWNDAIGGPRAVQLYLSEIVDLSMSQLDSAQWTLKHTAARSVADAVLAVSASEATMSTVTGNTIWPALEKALAGKTWEGKEVVLSALVKFTEIAGPYCRANESVRSTIVKIAIREAKRQNPAFRQHSIKSLGRIALACSDVDMSEAIFDVVEPLLLEQADESATDEDGSKAMSRQAEEIRDTTIAGAIETTFAAINPVALEGPVLIRQLARAIHTVAIKEPVLSAQLQSAYVNLAAALERMEKAKQRIDVVPRTETRMVEDLRTILFKPVLGNEALRLARADAIVAIAKTAAPLRAALDGDVQAILVHEVSATVRDRLHDAALEPRRPAPA